MLGAGATAGAAAVMPRLSNGIILEAGRSEKRLRCGERLVSAGRLMGTRSGAAARLPATTFNAHSDVVSFPVECNFLPQSRHRCSSSGFQC